MTLLSTSGELQCSLLAKVLFIFVFCLVSPSLRGGLGAGRVGGGKRSWGPYAGQRRNTLRFPSRGPLHPHCCPTLSPRHPQNSGHQRHLVASLGPGLPLQQPPSYVLASTMAQLPAKEGSSLRHCPPVLPWSIISPGDHHAGLLPKVHTTSGWLGPPTSIPLPRLTQNLCPGDGITDTKGGMCVTGTSRSHRHAPDRTALVSLGILCRLLFPALSSLVVHR